MHDIVTASAILTEVTKPIAQSVRSLAKAPINVQIMGASTALGAVYFGARFANGVAGTIRSRNDGTAIAIKPSILVNDMLGLVTSTCGLAATVLLSRGSRTP